MNSSHLLKWIEHPETLNKESLYELRTLMARYPYFQSLRLLYLKNLYLLHDDAYGAELRKSVLFIADRRVLFYQVEGERYTLRAHQSLQSSDAELDGESEKDRTLYLIDSFLASVPEDQSVPAELDYAMDYTAFLLDSDSSEPPCTEPQNSVPKFRGQSLIDDFLNKKDESLSLVDATEQSVEEHVKPLEMSADEAVGTDENQVEVLDDKEDSHMENVDDNQFETPDEEADEETVSVSEVVAEDETFTETLAKIYIKQHRYDKALEIIKKLSLNYPKKNAYFADQIRFLEKLIINAKSK